MKDLPSSQRTVSEVSSESVLIEEKNRYIMTSSATKALSKHINRFTPSQSNSETINDERVVGNQTPSILSNSHKIAEESHSAGQTRQTEAPQ